MRGLSRLGKLAFEKLGGSGLLVAALLSLAVLTPGTGPSEQALILEVASYAEPPVREDAWRMASSVANTRSHAVVCRQELKPNSRFTRKLCRKARDIHRSTLAAQSDLSDALMRTNVNVSGR